MTPMGKLKQCRATQYCFGFQHGINKEQHISTVHGEVKKFHCNVCNKTFAMKHELTQLLFLDKKYIGGN